MPHANKHLSMLSVPHSPLATRADRAGGSWLEVAAGMTELLGKIGVCGLMEKWKRPGRGRGLVCTIAHVNVRIGLRIDDGSGY